MYYCFSTSMPKLRTFRFGESVEASSIDDDAKPEMVNVSSFLNLRARDTEDLSTHM